MLMLRSKTEKKQRRENSEKYSAGNQTLIQKLVILLGSGIFLLFNQKYNNYNNTYTTFTEHYNLQSTFNQLRLYAPYRKRER